MDSFDPTWFLIGQCARLRRSAQRRRKAGKKSGMTQGVRQAAQALNSALIHLSQPGAKSPWFTDEEARAANEEREALLRTLSSRLNIDARGTKPHSGPLSAGCATCQEGYWGCNYITRRCQRNCFYCLRYHSMKTHPDAESDNFTFKSPAEHIAFLKTFRVRGVGFSGGEPLLALERLLEHVTAIRKELGDSFYLWTYTNGDLVTRDTLKSLKQAGLNEIRFDLSARGYDLSPAVLAREYIPTVTVEIPAIPEDLALLKEIIVEMQAIGIKHLNLHQLLAGQRTWKAYCARHYHFSCQRPPAVHESELCALRLLAYACEKQIALPINYCSLAYKTRFQHRGWRMRNALAAVEGPQEITDAGYIRSMSISDSDARIAALMHRFQAAGLDSKLWRLDGEPSRIALHGSLMPYVDWSSAALSIAYFRAEASLKDKSGRFGPGNLKVDFHRVKTLAGLGRPAFECWRRLYAEKGVTDACAQDRVRECGDAVSTAAAVQQLKRLTKYENLETGLPEIF
jgi:uncharacterized protein